MRDPDEFDAFYADARERLLLQTYALTGDLPAARTAVRDAFVAAWHHWRKVSRLEDPEGWVRPYAWVHGQRRHTARLWHREKGLDPEARATLDALGKLPTIQRRVLLLTQLASVSMAQMAREVGLPPDEASRQLQLATAQFSLHRNVPSTQLRPLWDQLAGIVAQERLPRSTIIRRSGTARRRTHTLVGAAGTVVALLLTGVAVTDDTGVRPTLERSWSGLPSAAEEGGADTGTEPVEPPDELLPEQALLGAGEVGRQTPGRGWSVTATHDNTAGDGLVLPCQSERYADRRGTAALFRTFEAAGRGGKAVASAFQANEASRSPKRARAAYRTSVDWFGGCTEGRPQLLSAWEAPGIGNRATVLALREWSGPTTLVVGVARSGALTTTVGVQVPGTREPDTRSVARLLGQAVEGICTLPDAGDCATGTRLVRTPPPPTGQVPAMLSEIDLPPVGVPRPWVGTEPRRATAGEAAIGCDQPSFAGRFEGARWSRNLARTFLVPEAKLPDAFGLTQAVGALPAAKARSFVGSVRSRMAGCAEDTLGTEVRRLRETSSGAREVSAWEVVTEISDQQSVRHLTALLRDGTALAQVGFMPAPGAAMTDAQFLALVDRALARLPRLPAPERRRG